MKNKPFTIKYEENEIESEFKVIKEILSMQWMSEKHSAFVAKYGPKYRTIVFHIIDNAPNVYAPEREELLKYFYVNQFTESDEGGGWNEELNNKTAIGELRAKLKVLCGLDLEQRSPTSEIGREICDVIERDLIEWIESNMPRSMFVRNCELVLGSDWQRNGLEILKKYAPELASKFKEYSDKPSVDNLAPSLNTSFKTILDLTNFLNHWMVECSIQEVQHKLIESLNIKIDKTENSWLTLELARRDHLLKAFTFSIEMEHECSSRIAWWDKAIDDEIKEITLAIDSKIFSFIQFYGSTTTVPLEKMKLKADYIGHHIVLEELKTFIAQNEIKDVEYFAQMVRWLVLNDNKAEAEQWIIKSHALKVIPLNIHFDFMMFYMSFDHGYRDLAKYAARILPQLNKDDRRGLVPFLLKQIDVGYLDKADLSAEVIAEIVLYQNELN
jgi:hypothetical protein